MFAGGSVLQLVHVQLVYIGYFYFQNLHGNAGKVEELTSAIYLQKTIWLSSYIISIPLSWTTLVFEPYYLPSD